jgi:hypothetical protein
MHFFSQPNAQPPSRPYLHFSYKCFLMSCFFSLMTPFLLSQTKVHYLSSSRHPQNVCLFHLEPFMILVLLIPQSQWENRAETVILGWSCDLPVALCIFSFKWNCPYSPTPHRDTQMSSRVNILSLVQLQVQRTCLGSASLS